MIDTVSKITNNIQNLPIQERYFLGIPLYVYATVLIPLIIFIIGQLILNSRERKKENRRLRILEKYVYLNLRKIIEDIQKDIKSIHDLVIKVKEEIQQNYTSTSSQDIHIENVLKLDRTDLYNIFINGRKGVEDHKIELYDKLITAVSRIDYNHKKFPTHFNEYLSYMKEYSNSYGDSIDNLRTAFENYIVMNENLGIKKSDDDFMTEFDMLMYEWTKLDEGETNIGPLKFDMFYVEKNVLPKFITFINQHKTDHRTRMLSDSIVEANTAISSFRNLKKVYSELFEAYLTSYNQSKKEIESSMSRFIAMKTKKIKV